MAPVMDKPEELAAIVRNQRAKDSALAKELDLVAVKHQ
jgi:hypothetical protein